MREQAQINRKRYTIIPEGIIKLTEGEGEDQETWSWTAIEWDRKTVFVEEYGGELTLWSPVEQLPLDVAWHEEAVRDISGRLECLWDPRKVRASGEEDGTAACSEGEADGEDVLRIVFPNRKPLFFTGVKLFEHGDNYATAHARAEDLDHYTIEVLARKEALVGTWGALTVLGIALVALWLELEAGQGALPGWTQVLVALWYMMCFVSMGFVLIAGTPSDYDIPAEILACSFVLYIGFKGVENIFHTLGKEFLLPIEHFGFSLIAASIVLSFLMFRIIRKRFYMLTDGGSAGALLVLILAFIWNMGIEEDLEWWHEALNTISMLAPFLIAAGAYYKWKDYRKAPDTEKQFFRLRDEIATLMDRTVNTGDREALREAGEQLNDLADGLRIAKDPNLAAFRNYMDNLRLLESVVKGAAEQYDRLERDFDDPADLAREIQIMVHDLRYALERGMCIRVSPILRGLVEHAVADKD